MSVRKQKTLICGPQYWEEFNHFRAKEKLIEVEHVKAHRTEMERQQMPLFDQFINEDNEKRMS